MFEDVQGSGVGVHDVPLGERDGSGLVPVGDGVGHEGVGEHADDGFRTDRARTHSEDDRVACEAPDDRTVGEDDVPPTVAGMGRETSVPALRCPPTTSVPAGCPETRALSANWMPPFTASVAPAWNTSAERGPMASELNWCAPASSTRVPPSRIFALPRAPGARLALVRSATVASRVCTLQRTMLERFAIDLVRDDLPSLLWRRIDWVRVVLLAIASFGLGAAWHRRTHLLGRIWARENYPEGPDTSRMNLPLVFGGTAVSHLLLIAFLSSLVSGSGSLFGLEVGFALSVFVVFATMAPTYLFAGRKPSLLLVDTGLYVVLLSVCGLILGL